jgi:hypothetical protein
MALDESNNTVTTYPGTIHFTTSDHEGTVPPDSGLTNGTAGFSATLGQTWTYQSITATDTSQPSITGTSNCIFIHKTTPAPVYTISGQVVNCAATPAPSVTMTLTGSMSNSTLTDSSGNYFFTNIAAGGTYTVVPSKAPRLPGSVGINTVDTIAIQRHFLLIVPIPPGCRLSAADAVVNGTINTQDVIATQRFFIGYTSGTGSVGQYKFTPTSSTYSNLGSSSVTNYSMYVVGDVSNPFVTRPQEAWPNAAKQNEEDPY